MSRVFSVVAASSEARERRTERQTTRARRARRARTPRVALAAAVEQGRSRAVFVFYSSSSLRVCRSARAAPSLHPRRRVARSPRAFVPSVVPRAPLSCSEPLRRRVGRAPREGARTHTERDARGRPAWGVRAPRALGESAAAFARRSPLGVWPLAGRPFFFCAGGCLSTWHGVGGFTAISPPSPLVVFFTVP